MQPVKPGSPRPRAVRRPADLGQHRRPGGARAGHVLRVVLCPVHVHVRGQAPGSAGADRGADRGRRDGGLLAAGTRHGLRRESAKVARLLVVVFAGLSAGMNYLAADVTSFRSVAVYVMPPAVFAVCTDQTVAVIRRTAWASPRTPPGPALGRVVLAAARLAGVVVLYGLRVVLDPAETARGCGGWSWRLHPSRRPPRKTAGDCLRGRSGGAPGDRPRSRCRS